jgi:hypothetical protein
MAADMFSNLRMMFPQRDEQDCTAPAIAVNAAFSARDPSPSVRIAALSP